MDEIPLEQFDIFAGELLQALVGGSHPMLQPCCPCSGEHVAYFQGSPDVRACLAATLAFQFRVYARRLSSGDSNEKSSCG